MCAAVASPWYTRSCARGSTQAASWCGPRYTLGLHVCHAGAHDWDTRSRRCHALAVACCPLPCDLACDMGCKLRCGLTCCLRCALGACWHLPLSLGLAPSRPCVSLALTLAPARERGAATVGHAPRPRQTPGACGLLAGAWLSAGAAWPWSLPLLLAAAAGAVAVAAALACHGARSKLLRPHTEGEHRGTRRENHWASRHCFSCHCASCHFATCCWGSRLNSGRWRSWLDCGP